MPDLVTGAGGNTGAAIARLLRADGREVRSLPNRTPTDLRAAFDGVATFYNTFWMRTGDPGSHGRSYTQALARSAELIDAARVARVERIVHLSVAHAGAPYPYFEAKAQVENLLTESGIPHAIVRPALIFGGAPALLEQLARILRRTPVFGVAGDGTYRVRPVHVEDVARLCVTAEPGTITDAVGPDRPTFDELVRAVAASIGRPARLVHLPPPLVVAAGRALGTLLHEDVLTRDELLSTIAGVADTDGPTTGSISLLSWLDAHPGFDRDGPGSSSP
jgi:NADH dehydrogenase